MTVRQMMKGGAIGALATAMAFTALPAEADAQGRGHGRAEQSDSGPSHGERGGGPGQQWSSREVRTEAAGASASRNWNANRQYPRMARPEVDADTSRRGGERTWQQPVPQTTVTPERRAEAQGRSNRGWNRPDRQPSVAQPGGGREWNRPDRQAGAAQPNVGREWNGSDRASDPARGGWSRNTTYAGDRNRTYRDPRRDDRNYDRNDTDRDGRNDNRWGNRYDNRDGYRNGYANGQRWSDSGRRSRYYDGRSWHDYDRWDRDGWRGNNRYDWYGYRDRNRGIYRIGRYYSPYRDYSYSRLYIGFGLNSLFYSSRYWINDPWRYRLPDVYGPYRWVRYYDDVLLVDIYSGEVVDVIYDFFW